MPEEMPLEVAQTLYKWACEEFNDMGADIQEGGTLNRNWHQAVSWVYHESQKVFLGNMVEPLRPPEPPIEFIKEDGSVRTQDDS